jgi:hypothetical protein
VLSRDLPGGTEINEENPTQDIVVPVKIRIKHLQNTKQKRYHLSSLALREKIKGIERLIILFHNGFPNIAYQ